MFQIPVALVVAQVKNEVGDNPGLLWFSEVLKLFHEFGHMVCQLSLFGLCAMFLENVQFNASFCRRL